MFRVVSVVFVGVADCVSTCYTVADGSGVVVVVAAFDFVVACCCLW